MLELGFVDYCEQLYGMPIFAMDFKNFSHHRKHLNQTYCLGYEFGKLCGLQRKLRFYLEYHDGFCPDGQFSRIPDNYFSIRTSYTY